jgi:hypothetical protein
MRAVFFSLIVALLAASPAAFADAQTAPVVQNMSVKEFLKFHDDVAKRLEKKEFARVSDTARDKIATAQSKIRQALSGKQNMDELSDIERVTVFNAHEVVVAEWNEAEDERLICRRQNKVGSHRPETVCKTVAEIEAERTDTRREHFRVRKCATGEACG